MSGAAPEVATGTRVVFCGHHGGNYPARVVRVVSPGVVDLRVRFAPGTTSLLLEAVPYGTEGQRRTWRLRPESGSGG